jgi:hypothetical protein
MRAPVTTPRLKETAMDGARFDAMTRGLRASLSRRGALGIAAAAILGGAVRGLASHRGDDPPRRRNACQVRCGLEQRLCKVGCRDMGVATNECKRLCKVTRDGCFLRCEFRGPRERWGTGRKTWAAGFVGRES